MSLELVITLSTLSIVLVLAGIRGTIADHTREVRAIAEEQAERRRIERQHAANVSARWQG